jgi:hypothetical protein
MLFLKTKEAAQMRLTLRRTTCYTAWVPPDPNPDPKNRQPVLNVMNSLCKNLWKAKFAGEKSGFALHRHPRPLKTLNLPPPNKPRKPGKPQVTQAKSGGSQAKSQVKPKTARPPALLAIGTFAATQKSGCHARFHPNANPHEAAQVLELGEVVYNRQKFKTALAWIAARPARFAALTWERFLFAGPHDTDKLRNCLPA